MAVQAVAEAAAETEVAMEEGIDTAVMAEVAVAAAETPWSESLTMKLVLDFSLSVSLSL